MLRDQLETVRSRGFAATYEEYHVGLVAMPIRSLGGGVAATLAISGPAFQVNEHSLPVLLTELEPAAAKISWRAGSLTCG